MLFPENPVFTAMIRKKHMLSKIHSEQIYLGDYGWHTARFHFSFADYNDPENAHFGDLLALNDFVLSPDSGFDTHSHQEIEIISYCVEGELIHEDSMGNKNMIRQGEMQYTCAGSGITHSEFNNSLEKPLRFVQIWIKPDSENLTPRYSSIHFTRTDRLNKLLQIASGQQTGDVPQINQDANIFVAEIERGTQVQINHIFKRQIYLACLEGALNANNASLENGDSIKVWDEEALTLAATINCHLLMVDVSRNL
jgi:quercetin 2,3-dioxygenase